MLTDNHDSYKRRVSDLINYWFGSNWAAWESDLTVTLTEAQLSELEDLIGGIKVRVEFVDEFSNDHK